MAVVSRDHRENLIEAWTEQISPKSSILGEEATRCSIHRAAARGFNSIIIEASKLQLRIFLNW